jgi:hypothetical protein
MPIFAQDNVRATARGIHCPPQRVPVALDVIARVAKSPVMALLRWGRDDAAVAPGCPPASVGTEMSDVQPEMRILEPPLQRCPEPRARHGRAMRCQGRRLSAAPKACLVIEQFIPDIEAPAAWLVGRYRGAAFCTQAVFRPRRVPAV